MPKTKDEIETKYNVKAGSNNYKFIKLLSKKPATIAAVAKTLYPDIEDDSARMKRARIFIAQARKLPFKFADVANTKGVVTGYQAAP